MELQVWDIERQWLSITYPCDYNNHLYKCQPPVYLLVKWCRFHFLKIFWDDHYNEWQYNISSDKIRTTLISYNGNFKYNLNILHKYKKINYEVITEITPKLYKNLRGRRKIIENYYKTTTQLGHLTTTYNEIYIHTRR